MRDYGQGPGTAFTFFGLIFYGFAVLKIMDRNGTAKQKNANVNVKVDQRPF